MSLGDDYLAYRKKKDASFSAPSTSATTAPDAKDSLGDTYLVYRAEKDKQAQIAAQQAAEKANEINVRPPGSALDTAAWKAADMYEEWASGLGFKNAPYADYIRDTRADTALYKEAEKKALETARPEVENLIKARADSSVKNALNANQTLISSERAKSRTPEEAMERITQQEKKLFPDKNVVHEDTPRLKDDVAIPFLYKLAPGLVDPRNNYTIKNNPYGTFEIVDGEFKIKDKAEIEKQNKEVEEWIKSRVSGEGKEGLRKAVTDISSGAGYLGQQIALYATGSAILQGIPKLNSAFQAIKNPAVRAVVKDLSMDVMLETAINTPQVISRGMSEGKSGGDIAKDVLKEQGINAAIGVVMAGVGNSSAIKQAISDYNAGKATREALEKTVRDETESIVRDEFGNVIDKAGIARNEFGQAIDPNTGFAVEAYREPDMPHVGAPVRQSPVPEAAPVAQVDEVSASSARQADDVVMQAPEGMEIRRVSQRIAQDPTQPLEIRQGVSEDIRSYYERFTDVEGRAKGAAIIQEAIDAGKDPVSVIGDRLSQGRFNKADIAAGVQLYNEIAATDMKRAQDLLADLAGAATEAGQNVQAFHMLKTSLNGDGIDYMVTKQIDKINKEGAERLGKRWKEVKKTDEIQALIKQRASATDQLAKNNIDAQIDSLIQSQISHTAYEKLNAWRHTAMLLNPKTHLRNVVGNSLNYGISKPKDAMAQLFEKFIPKSQRTKAVLWRFDKNVADIVEGQKKVLDEAVNAMQRGSKYEITTFGTGRKVFTGGAEKPGALMSALQKVSDFNYNMLTKEDNIFFKAAFADHLGQFIKARGLKEATGEAIEYATKMADRLTFRTTTRVSKWLSDASQYKGVKEAVDVVLPFKKTPINIAVESARYSPLGVAKALTKDLAAVRAGKKTFAEFIDQLAAGFTGTGLMALGAYLFMNDIITGAPNKDADIAAFEKAAGKQPYAVKIGDAYITYDWAAPVGSWLAAGASIGDVMRGDADFTSAMLSGSTAAIDSLFNASVFKNLRDSLSSPYSQSVSDTMAELGADYLMSYIPSAFGALARTIDDTARTTKYQPGIIERSGAAAAIKTPGLSATQQPLVSTRGEETKRAGSASLRFFQEFLSPAYVSQHKVDDMDAEILNVYEATGDRAVFPKVAPKTFVYNKTTYRLTPEEATQFQTTMGQGTYQRLERLFSSPYYKRYGDTTKAKAIINAIDAAYDKAKKEVIKGRES